MASFFFFFFHASCGEAGGHVLLAEEEDDEHGQRHGYGRRGEHRPGAAHLRRLQRVEAGGQGVARLACHEGRGVDVLIPDVDEHHERRDHHAGLRERQHDAGHDLKVRRAVHPRRLLDLHGHGVEVALHVPEAEHGHGARIDYDEAQPVVYEPHGPQQPVDGEHAEYGREGV